MSSKMLINFLEKLFPLVSGFEWDNNGKNFYFENSDVKKCLVVLDINSKVINYAKNNNIKFIIAHHPIIFFDYEVEITNSIKKKLFQQIQELKITCYIIHTNYDYSKLGMNYKILNLLNASSVKLLNQNDVVYKGILQKEKTFKELVIQIKNIIPTIDYVQYVGDLNNKIKNIAIVAGSGNQSSKIIDSKIDLYITGELKWSIINELIEKNVNILMLGHYMESYFVSDVAKILKNKLNNVSIIEYNINNNIKILNI